MRGYLASHFSYEGECEMRKLLVSLLLCILAVPAYAVEFKFNDDMSLDVYGEFKFRGFYEYKDTGTSIDNDFQLDIEDHSFIGFGLTLSEKLSLNAEIGARPFNDSNFSTQLAQFYGTYKNDLGMEILFGKAWTSSDYFIGGQVSLWDNALNDYGTLFPQQKPQLAVSWNGFKIALVRVNTAEESALQNALGTGYKVKSVIPRIDVDYNMDFANVNFKVFGAYLPFTIDKPNGDTENMNAMHAGFGGQATFGNLYLRATGFWGYNANIYGALTRYTSVLVDNKGEFQNTTTIGGAVLVGYNINEVSYVEAGYGYNVSSNDAALKDDPAMAYFVNYSYWMNDYLKLTPEIAVMDDMKNNAGAEQGMFLLTGVQASIYF